MRMKLTASREDVFCNAWEATRRYPGEGVTWQCQSTGLSISTMLLLLLFCRTRKSQSKDQ